MHKGQIKSIVKLLSTSVLFEKCLAVEFVHVGGWHDKYLLVEGKTVVFASSVLDEKQKTRGGVQLGTGFEALLVDDKVVLVGQWVSGFDNLRNVELETLLQFYKLGLNNVGIVANLFELVNVFLANGTGSWVGGADFAHVVRRGIVIFKGVRTLEERKLVDQCSTISSSAIGRLRSRVGWGC